MESSHVPLTKWALAYRLMASSKKGFSAHQLHRTLGVTYKTAWFMAHRIREAMRPIDTEPMGGEGKFSKQTKPTSAARRRTAPMRKHCRATKRSCRWSSAAAKSARIMSRTYGKDAETDPGRSYCQGLAFPHRSSPGLYRDRDRLCEPRHGQPLNQGVRPRRRAHEHGRGLFLDLQARHLRHVSPCQRGTPEAVSVRVRFSLQ